MIPIIPKLSITDSILAKLFSGNLCAHRVIHVSSSTDQPRRYRSVAVLYLVFASIFGSFIAASLKNPEPAQDDNDLAYQHSIDVPPAPSFDVVQKAFSTQVEEIPSAEKTVEIKSSSQPKAQEDPIKRTVAPVWVDPKSKVQDAFVPTEPAQLPAVPLILPETAPGGSPPALPLVDQKPTTNRIDLSPPEIAMHKLGSSAASRMLIDDPAVAFPTLPSSSVPSLERLKPLPVENKRELYEPQIIAQLVKLPELSHQPEMQWSRSDRLSVLLEPLEKIEKTKPWATRVQQSLNQLYETPAIADQQANEAITSLEKLSTEVAAVAEDLGYTWERTQLIQASFGLSRRLSIWRQTHDIMVQGTYATESAIDPQLMLPKLDAVESMLREGGQLLSWNDFLMLDDVRDGSSFGMLPEDRHSLAEAILSRMQSPMLNSKQQDLMNEPVFTAFRSELSAWAGRNISFPNMLKMIEYYESNLDSKSANELAQSIQALLSSNQPEVKQLGQTLDHSYRNANIRFAVSEDFMNALVPKMEAEDEDVNDYILGNLVRGRSRTSNVLKVHMVPDARQWRLQLDVNGVVDSNTSSYAGPITIFNRGRSRYQAAKQLVINQNGFWVSKAVANAQTATDISDLQSDYDGIPLIGSIVRNVAMSQTEAKKQEAEREVRYKIKRRAEKELDQGLNEKVEQWQDQLLEKVVVPLQKLKVQPSVIEMQTTDNQLVGRFRIAGDVQLGAHAPRPVAASGSVFSMQVHESTLNNMLEQLKLSGRRATVEQLLKDAEGLFKGLDEELLDQIPLGAEIEFAAVDPVRIRLVDDQVRLTLQIAELKSGRNSWKNFSVRATYSLNSDQLDAQLVRSTSIQLKGEKLRFRDQITLRVVFTKILSKNLIIPILPAHLLADSRIDSFEASQLAIHEGWFALAIRPKSSSEPKRLPVRQAQRLVVE